MRYKECLDYIRSDYYRVRGNRNVNILRMLFTTIMEEGFRYLFWFRLSNCDNILLSGVSRIFYRIIGSNLRISIREFGIRKGLKKLVISSKIRIFIGENQ